MYEYRATVKSIYDGDTVRLDIDLGMGNHELGPKGEGVSVRLARINAPEVRGENKEAGLASRNYLRGILQDKKIVIKTDKDKRGKYGRYIVEIFLDGININDQLVQEGLAVYKNY